METFNQEILEYLRDLLLIKVGVGESLVEVGKERFAKMQAQAEILTSQQLSHLINKFTQSYENLVQSSIPTLPLEVAIVEVTTQDQKVEKEEIQVGKTPPRKTPGVSPSTPGVKETAGLGNTGVESDDQWQELMRRIKPLNHSVAALLRSCEPARVKGRELIIHALYPFHKERLEEPKNKAILEQVAKEVYGKKLKLRVQLARSQ